MIKFFLLFFSFCFYLQGAQLLVFEGPKECSWSEKTKEILSQEDFKQTLDKKISVVPIDFSQEALRKKYHIEIFPTFLLLSSTSERIAQFTFLPLDAGEYALHLNEILHFKNQLDDLVFKNLNASELEEVYLKAQGLDLSDEAARILQFGLKVDKGTFFLVEKYAEGLKTKRASHPEMESLRNKILARDPNNKKGTALRLAILEFEAKESRGAKNPRFVVKPLIEYTKTYKDKENMWWVEMMIASYYLSLNRNETGLLHAKTALQYAPDEKKSQIEEFIQSYSKD